MASRRHRFTAISERAMLALLIAPMPSAIITSRPTNELLEAVVTYDGRSFTVEFLPSDEGGYTVRVQDLRGCISEGDTIEEAIENIREALETYLTEEA